VPDVVGGALFPVRVQVGDLRVVAVALEGARYSSRSATLKRFSA